MLVAALVFGGWFLFLRGDGSGDTSANGETEPQESTVSVVSPVATDAVDPSTGLPLRPGVRLEHPSGASADIPGGSALYGDAMDLRAVELADDPWWDHGGSGWEFVSFVGIPITGATVDIPAGSAGGRLIALSATGLWVELPAEGITLANGKPGFRVTVDGIPAPWTFAVATPKAGALEVTPEMQDALRREQLYWTDREAWEREAVAWYRARPATLFPSDARVSLQPAPGDEYERIRVRVLDTYQLFAVARAGLAPDPMVAVGQLKLPGLEIASQGVWAAGVVQLAQVRDEWLAFRESVGDINALPANSAVAIGFMDQWIETAMYNYTPWGLELVKVLLESGDLDGFDIRVLKPYGELKWADIVLKEGDAPAIDFAVQQVLANEQAARIAGVPTIERTLRFYSVRALERLAIVDWLKENVDWIVRWLPVALASVGLIPGAVGLSLFFAAVDQLVNWAQDWYTAGDTSPYAYMAFEGASAGGLGGTSFLMDMWEESVEMSTEGRAMLPAHGLTIAQFAYSAGMFAAVRGTDWYLFKTIREINQGTQGYCRLGRCAGIGGTIPPVMINVRAAGPQEVPELVYPVVTDRMMAYRLEYGSANYHTDWLIGRKGPSAPLADLSFNDYSPRSWPVAVIRAEPDYQVARITVPKSAIDPELWGDLPKDTHIGAFSPVLTLKGPDGASATIEISQESTRRSNESADNFYFTVALLRDDRDIPLAPGLATFGATYELAREQMADFPGPDLRTKIEGSLQFGGEGYKPLTFELDYTRPQPQPAGSPAASPGVLPPRAHIVEVALTNDIFGFYDLTSWAVVGGTPDWIANYADIRETYAACDTSPAACYLQVLQFGGQRRIAELYGKHDEGLFFEDFADSEVYLEGWGEDGVLLAPEAHDNFFKLDGPVLTGSSFWNVAGNPGSPAQVMGWQTIQAEFKDGRVTGTLSEHQMIEGVEVMTISFAFEGVLRK